MCNYFYCIFGLIIGWFDSKLIAANVYFNFGLSLTITYFNFRPSLNIAYFNILLN